VELTPIRAIRRKCLECSCYSYDEIKNCLVELCPLWPFRLGKDPSRKKRVMTEEQKAAAVERLRRASK